MSYQHFLFVKLDDIIPVQVLNFLKEYLTMYLYVDICTCFDSILTDQLAEIEIEPHDQRLM